MHLSLPLGRTLHPEIYISMDSFQHTYLIDVHVLGHIALYTPAIDNLHTVWNLLPGLEGIKS